MMPARPHVAGEPPPEAGAARLATALVLSALFLVLAVTTFPWAFERAPVSTTITPTPDAVPTRPLAPFWRMLLDSAGNVALFAALGFALAAREPRRGGVLGVLAPVVLLAVGVEWLQTRLPGRDPSLRDVVVAAAGAWSGLVLWRRVGDVAVDRLAALIRLTERVPAWLPVLVVPLWATLAVMVTAEWQATTRTTNWNESHPLLIGNEATGDRPWRGELWELLAYDGVPGPGWSDPAPPGMRVAEYTLRSADRGRDEIRARPPDPEGLGPVLLWRGAPRAGSDEGPHHAAPRAPVGTPGGFTGDGPGLVLDGTRWLQSAGPATELNRALAAGDGFALAVELATADTTQTGPARIVSLSYDVWHRNLMLGQQGDALVVRLRTPATGRNGSDPEWIVPGVFTDTGRHRLALTWSGGTARLFVDGEPRGVFELTAGGALFGGWLDPRAELLWGWQVLLLMLLVIPPAKWAAVAAARLGGAVGLVLALLTPLAIEGLMVARHLRPVRPHELAAGVGLALFGLGLTALWLRAARVGAPTARAEHAAGTT